MYHYSKIIHVLLCAMTLTASCNKEPAEVPENGTQRAMGWNQSTEDNSKYPSEISFGFMSSGNSANLPSSVDLSDKLPPVGDQGQYGTCITW